MIKPFKMYFDQNGDMRRTAYNYNGVSKEEDNHQFADKMVYLHRDGKSHVVFKSLTSGRKYLMFDSDFHQIIFNKKFNDNIIDGEFVYTKKGQVQGFRMLFPKTPATP